MSEYEPGTIAVATVRGVHNVRVMRNQLEKLTWFSSVRVRGAVGHEDRHVADIRPLGVLDPEDDATIDRVADAIRDHHGRSRSGVWTGIDWLCTREALRSLTRPPKPEEPTGLGAVVTAVCSCQSDTVRFVRDDTGSEHVGLPWKSGCGHHIWSDLDSVRIISEGVK